MKRIIFNIGALFMIGGLVVSCSPDDGSSCPEDYTGALQATEEKLVGEWVLSGIMADEAVDITDDDQDNPSTDLFVQYDECQKEAAYTFDEDRSYTYQQGINGTDCPNRASISGSWQFSSSTLSIIFSCDIQNLVITLNGSDTAFSFSNNFNVTDIDGNVVNTDITFTYSLVP
ncbi:DUF5004 domain-containing protein [Flagellimonas iocasae]|uniref:DUF5004 domain-containing protein n=1 Tax=Flagellimonas iocasae TaxID=2055905 RepID=A0ABW4XY45_9FLAO